MANTHIGMSGRLQSLLWVASMQNGQKRADLCAAATAPRRGQRQPGGSGVTWDGLARQAITFRTLRSADTDRAEFACTVWPARS